MSENLWVGISIRRAVAVGAYLQWLDNLVIGGFEIGYWVNRILWRVCLGNFAFGALELGTFAVLELGVKFLEAWRRCGSATW